MTIADGFSLVVGGLLAYATWILVWLVVLLLAAVGISLLFRR